MHFQFYDKGIFNPKHCKTEEDHAITAVGYGKGGKTGDQEFLIVRNSWGADWGEAGYIRIALNGDGEGVCGILKDSSRPTTD